MARTVIEDFNYPEPEEDGEDGDVFLHIENPWADHPVSFCGITFGDEDSGDGMIPIDLDALPDNACRICTQMYVMLTVLPRRSDDGD